MVDDNEINCIQNEVFWPRRYVDNKKQMGLCEHTKAWRVENEINRSDESRMAMGEGKSYIWHMFKAGMN